MAMALGFARTFKECRAKVGSLEFEVTEESMVRAIGLSTMGEKWFKKERIERKIWCRFVVD